MSAGVKADRKHRKVENECFVFNMQVQKLREIATNTSRVRGRKTPMARATADRQEAAAVHKRPHSAYPELDDRDDPCMSH